MYFVWKRTNIHKIRSMGTVLLMQPNFFFFFNGKKQNSVAYFVVKTTKLKSLAALNWFLLYF